MIAEWLFGALTLAGCAFHVVSAAAARKFARTKVQQTDQLPPVSVIKPIRGTDPDAYENFASFCGQEYPEYELLFGVQDPDDPAVGIVHRLQADFPDTPIRLVVSDLSIGANRKLNNIAGILEEARYGLLLISDSDMRVRPEYLRQIVAHFADPNVGLVTSPYRGIGARSPSAGLEALGMATEFFPGAAVATQFAAPAFAFGSTLALTREMLAEIGGLEGLADYLADDFQMGYRVAGLGRRVAMSRYVVDTALPNAGFRLMFWRRLRWMRTARICQPAGFAGSVVTHSTVWALALLAASGFQPWAWAVLAAQQLLRWGTAWYIAIDVLRSDATRTWFPLLPFSDLLNFVLWAGSWFGNTVYWRGDRFRLTRGGRMVRID